MVVESFVWHRITSPSTIRQWMSLLTMQVMVTTITNLDNFTLWVHLFITCQDQSRFCERPSQNHIRDKGVAKNHTKAIDNLVIYRLNIIEADFILGYTIWFEHFYQIFAIVKCAVQPCDIFPDHTSVTSCILLEHLMTSRSDVIAPVGITSLWRNYVIAPVGVMSSRRQGRTLGLEFLN
jgi:hypothetical protein